MTLDTKESLKRAIAAYRFGKEEESEVSPTIPKELIASFGGVVGEYAAYINDISPAKNEQTAFLGSLSFNAFCASRRFRTESNLTPELYLVALCPSGGGKDLPRKTNCELAFKIGAVNNCVMDIASGEGGEDMIMDHAKILAQIDEFDTMMRAISEDRGGTKESLIRFILQAYTSGGSFMKRRQKARVKDAQDSRSYCHRPGLTVFGTGIKSMFFAALSERAMSNGMFARMLVCPCDSREMLRDVTWRDIDDAIVTRFVAIAGAYAVEQGGDRHMTLPDKPMEKPTPIVVTMDEGAVDELAGVTVMTDQWYRSFPDTEDGEAGRSIANRTREHTIRLAMNRAISRDGTHAKMTRSDIEWGYAFTRWSQRAMIKAASEYTYRNEFDEQMKRVERMISRKKKATTRDIYRNLRMSQKEADEVLQSMAAAGTIYLDPDGYYRLEDGK